MLWKGFQKPKRLAVDTQTLTDKYGIFWAQPFERGFGTTIGNALRRVLLSSIEGAAVTAVKIEGVLHEFQSIPGVVEDATDIILNLKQIPFKLSGDAPKAIYLRADQPGVVTSGMIEAARPRLRLRRQEFRRRPRHRFHSHRLRPLSGAQVQLHSRSRASRADHGLR
jgi:DNA-directed RNA polymerase subunit alpha